MKSILKKTSSDPITFEDIINKQIKLMQNSTDEYNKFLKLLDNLITRIDLTMDSMRLTVINKTVRFTEYNEVFLIPPRETPPRNNLTIPFLNPFYWKMPPSRTSRYYPTAFSSDELFQFSSTTTDIRHVYLLLGGHRHTRDNYATFVFLRQMIVRQEEEAEQRWQQELNKLNLLHEFTEAAFEEACSNELHNILQPIIHFRQERNHHHHHRMGFSPPVIPSDSSSLPSPLQQSQWPSIPSPIISHSSDNSDLLIPQAPVGSFHNPIIVEDDDSDNDTTLPNDNTWCSRCHRYIYNNFHSEEYCDTIFVPGAPVMVCRWCGLHGHLMLDCREIVCTWCDTLGHIIDDCPNLDWTILNLGSLKVARVVLQFHLHTYNFIFSLFFTNTFRTTCHKRMFFLSLSFPMHNAHVTC